MSLNALVENLSTPISRAGINERFNERVGEFLRGVYRHLFAVITATRNMSLPVDIFKKFKHIQIIDSSSWKVPVSLKKTFPGANQAGCKIQYMLDYKTGNIQHSNISPENLVDQKYSKTMAELLEPNDLCIFDLGFAIPEAFGKINAKKAFFICRFNDAAVNIYVDDNPLSARIDILKWLSQMTSHQTMYEIPCFVGNENQKTNVRLLAVKVPEEVANRRRQKLRVHAQKKGSIPKERSLQLCNWTLLITNISSEKNITFQEIFALYSIRWTVEIFFKQLKSILQIHKTYVKNNPHRLEAEILARSIVALFIAFCFSVARSYSWRKDNREISFEKTVKYFKRHAAILLNIFLRSLRAAAIYIDQMISKIILFCEKYRQSTRTNSIDKLIDQTIYKNFKHVKFNQSKLVGILA